MPKSKHRKKHATQLQKFKTNKLMEKQNVNIPQLPPVRSVPTWTNDAVITLTGYEWEAIQNGLTQVQIAQQAAQAVLSRHIVEGIIKLDFEKLNPQTLQYEQMTDEEKAPYVQNLEATIQQIKNPTVAKDEQESIIEQPVSGIVDQNGAPLSSDTQEEGGKIITMTPGN